MWKHKLQRTFKQDVFMCFFFFNFRFLEKFERNLKISLFRFLNLHFSPRYEIKKKLITLCTSTVITFLSNLTFSLFPKIFLFITFSDFFSGVSFHFSLLFLFFQLLPFSTIPHPSLLVFILYFIHLSCSHFY